MTGDIVEKDSMTGKQLSDIEAASRVRMLMRDDLNHEFVCMLGRDRIMYLSQQLQVTKDMLFAVTAVCNGSSAMEHLDALRNADTMLQESEKEKFRAALEEISKADGTPQEPKHVSRSAIIQIAKNVLAESV